MVPSLSLTRSHRAVSGFRRPSSFCLEISCSFRAMVSAFQRGVSLDQVRLPARQVQGEVHSLSQVAKGDRNRIRLAKAKAAKPPASSAYAARSGVGPESLRVMVPIQLEGLPVPVTPRSRGQGLLTVWLSVCVSVTSVASSNTAAAEAQTGLKKTCQWAG